MKFAAQSGNECTTRYMPEMGEKLRFTFTCHELYMDGTDLFFQTVLKKV